MILEDKRSNQNVQTPRTAEVPMWIDINAIDYYGNSALMLAHKLMHIDAIRVLCDHGANPKFKPIPQVQSPYDLAVVEANREMLTLYVQANQKLK